ncbi:uncharacterized protein LOC141685646 [Apium graveolens]|uniref:uncharacterized protein LOC141685646 n=1 Tax=Apium graveolens TaxID=4045 RepID=UPI003D7ABA05
MARECKLSGLIRNFMSVATTSATVPTEVLALPSPSEPDLQASSWTFNLKKKDAVQNSDVIAGKLSINNVEAKVLIDSRATRPLISESFAGRINCDKKDMNEVMNIVISNQEKVPVSQFCPECEIDVSGHKFPVDLILFKIGEFNIILGLDWLGKNIAQIDCKSKRVYLRSKNGMKVVFKGQKKEQLFLTAVQASKLLRKGAEPVLKAPYKMAPAEMKELASQLQELLNKYKAQYVAMGSTSSVCKEK